MSCSRTTGIWTVTNAAHHGHSKSEYSVTSTGAESLPSVKPRKPSAATAGTGAVELSPGADLWLAEHSSHPPPPGPAPPRRPVNPLTPPPPPCPPPTPPAQPAAPPP